MKEKSCGIIVFKNDKVLMVRQKSGIYGFPKGHMEKGESEEETAIRETKEETNIDALITSDKKYKVFYKTKNNKDKEVVYFIGTPINDDIKPQENEINEVLWINIEDVYNMLSFDNIKEMWIKVKTELQ